MRSDRGVALVFFRCVPSLVPRVSTLLLRRNPRGRFFVVPRVRVENVPTSHLIVCYLVYSVRQVCKREAPRKRRWCLPFLSSSSGSLVLLGARWWWSPLAGFLLLTCFAFLCIPPFPSVDAARTCLPTLDTVILHWRLARFFFSLCHPFRGYFFRRRRRFLCGDVCRSPHRPENAREAQSGKPSSHLALFFSKDRLCACSGVLAFRSPQSSWYYCVSAAFCSFFFF